MSSKSSALRVRSHTGAALLARWTIALLFFATTLGSSFAGSHPAGHAAWNYQIASGQTLIGISEELLDQPGDWPKLQKLNKIANPRRLQPGSVLLIPFDLLKRTATVAEVVFVRGGATRLADSADSKTEPQKLSIGDRVRSRDVIRTGDTATLSLRFADGSRMLVGPASEVSVIHLLEVGRTGIPDVLLDILQGSTEIHVVPQGGRRFEIRTPAMNLGVRGTDFRARVDNGGKTGLVEVLSGRVAAQANREEVGVNAGFGTLAEVGKDVQPPRLLLDPPDLSQVNPRQERIPIRFEWSPLPEAKAYHAQILASTDPEKVLLDSQFSQPVARWVDLPDGSYVLRVRAVSADGLEGRDATRQIVVKARPEAPFTNSPAPLAKVYGESTVFAWAAVGEARRYRLQVARDAAFSKILLDDPQIAGTSRELKLEPGDYYWRIGSIAATADGKDDPGPFGEAQQFTQRPLPPIPKTEAPKLSDEGLRMRWAKPETGQQVRFQIASDDKFETILLDQTTTEDSGLLSKPGPGKYFIRVRTIDADGFQGNFGAVQTFLVPDTPPSPWWMMIPLILLLTL